MTHLAFAIDGGGGNLTYQRNLAAALAGEKDVQSDFLTIPIYQRDAWERLPLVGRNPALTASARTAVALYAAGRRRPLDAAFIHSQSLALFSVPLMHRVPTLISTDGTPANYDTFADQLGHTVRAKPIEAAKRLWTKSTFSAAKRVLGFSGWVRDSLINDYGCPEEKIEIVASGVDVDRWKPDGAARGKGEKLKLLFTGGNFAGKGGPELLRWKAESHFGNDVELHLVTQAQLPPLDGVVVHRHMTPNAPELVQLAQSCDLFVLPTRGDCFPFAVIEAEATGLPVVASDVGGMREIVADGETGFLVPRGDFGVLLEKIDQLVEDPGLRARMGASGRERAVAKFDARVNSRRVLQLMLELAAA